MIVVGTIKWCEINVKSGDLTCGMGLRDISRREFDKLINKRKFSVLNSWVNTPYLSQFFAGKVNGIDTCIFSISTSRYSPITLGVLLSSIDTPFPSFFIRSKSFSQEVGDMLGMRQHHAAYPDALIDKYDVSSEDDGRFSAMLTPEIIRFFLDNEGVSVEVLGGGLLVTPSFKSDPKNYELAVERVLALVQMLGVNIAKQGNDLASLAKQEG